jgi:hypothetical protein
MRWADRCLRLGGIWKKEKGGASRLWWGGRWQISDIDPDLPIEQPIGQRKPALKGRRSSPGWYSGNAPNGYGFLRDPEANYVRQLSDPFVPAA